MKRYSILAACFLFLLGAFTQAQQTSQEELLKVTRTWLTDISKGDRVGLGAIMDPQCIFTTPAGDVLTKDRLVPDDPSQAVQQLPAMDIESPLARVYGETAVLMAHLKMTGDSKQSMNGTFVFSKKDSVWKVVAIHLSEQR